MNTSVSATGMQVQAKSDVKFLQIKESAASWNDSDAFTLATVSTGKKQVYPVHAYKAVTDSDSDGKLDTVEAFDGTTLVWASSYSTSPADAVAGVGTTNPYTIVATPETDHALKNIFTVRLKPNTGVTTAENLKVSSVTIAAVVQTPDDVIDSLIASIRILFVCGDNKVVWKNGSFVEGTANSILADAVTNADTTITTYVYFDGADASCTTNNALTPDDYTVSFNLSIE